MKTIYPKIVDLIIIILHGTLSEYFEVVGYQESVGHNFQGATSKYEIH